jgi:hypothetical protein
VTDPRVDALQKFLKGPCDAEEEPCDLCRGAGVGDVAFLIQKASDFGAVVRRFLG